MRARGVLLNPTLILAKQHKNKRGVTANNCRKRLKDEDER